VRHIRKGRTPSALDKFRRENARTPHVFAYDNLPGDVRRALTRKMLKEQGRLCAYTMRRIGDFQSAAQADFHVEHIRSQKEHPELRLDYLNIVLCSPGADRSRCEWGAKYKDDALVDERNFLSPLRADCETRLAFRADGRVFAADATDHAAKATVDVLNLNHHELIADRAGAMRALGLGRSVRKRLGPREADRLSRRICLPNSNGDFEPFCVAIRQVAEVVARKSANRAARLRSAR